MKWKPVPVEPDDEQREAGHHAAWRSVPSLFDESDAANVYRAMLEASPQPQALSDERILELFHANNLGGIPSAVRFARAIEREILGGGE